MDSIDSLLHTRRPQEPPQVAALKKYAQDHHKVTIDVRSASKYYLITVPGASLAHKFRLETPEIIKYCALDKRLVIHIGH